MNPQGGSWPVEVSQRQASAISCQRLAMRGPKHLFSWRLRRRATACSTWRVVLDRSRDTLPCLSAPTGRVVGLDLNSGMLNTARAMPIPEGITIEWREGNASALPFPNASFDVVCCQQGLQFFPDRPAALRDMHRVLAPNGRLALAVWRGLEHQPFYAALTEALERYVSSEAAASLRAAFTLRDRNDIRALVAEAGFRDIRIRIRSRLTRYPSLAEYVLGYLSGTPMAGPVAALDDVVRREMVEYVCSSLREYVDDDGMAAPWESASRDCPGVKSNPRHPEG